MVRLSDRLDMTIAVDWDVIPQTKQKPTKHKFILLINIKMPTIVGILSFISRINTTSESFKARLFFHHFTSYERLKFHAQLS